MLFDGFTKNGKNEIMDVLPEIIKSSLVEVIVDFAKLMNKKKKDDEDEDKEGGLLGMFKKKFPGVGIIKSALGVAGILGGVITLLHGMADSGPFKGLQKIIGTGLLKGGTMLAGPLLRALTTLAKSVQSSLIQIPFKLIKNFKKSFGSIIGKGIGAAAKMGAVGGLRGFIGKFVQGALKAFAKAPVIGGLISLGFAVSRFMKGDVVGGGLDILSGIASSFGIWPLALAIDGLNAVLDFKTGGASAQASAKKTDLMGKWIKGMGLWMWEKVQGLPVIGPAIKAFNYLKEDQYAKGLKQLAYVIPGMEVIGSMLGDTDVTGASQGVGKAISGTAGFLGKVAKWVGSALYKTVKALPVIGPVIKSIEEFSSGNFLKGLKQLAYIIPPFEVIGSMLGDKETGMVSKATGGVVGIIGSLTKWFAKFFYTGLKQLPILGPALKSAEEFASGNFSKGLKQLAYMNPAFEIIGSLLGDKETSPITRGGVNIAGIIGNIGKFVLTMLYKGVKLLPKIGPLLQAGEEFLSGNFLKGIKQLAYVLPPLQFLGGLLGDKEAGGIVGGAGAAVGGILKSLTKWLGEKILEIPIIGPVIKGIGLLVTDPIKAFKELALSIPGVSTLVDFFSPSQSTDKPSIAERAINFFGKIKDMMLRKLISFIPEKILGISVRSRVAKLLGISAEEPQDDADQKQADNNSPKTEEQKQKAEEERVKKQQKEKQVQQNKALGRAIKNNPLILFKSPKKIAEAAQKEYDSTQLQSTTQQQETPPAVPRIVSEPIKQEASYSPPSQPSSAAVPAVATPPAVPRIVSEPIKQRVVETSNTKEQIQETEEEKAKKQKKENLLQPFKTIWGHIKKDPLLTFAPTMLRLLKGSKQKVDASKKEHDSAQQRSTSATPSPAVPRIVPESIKQEAYSPPSRPSSAIPAAVTAAPTPSVVPQIVPESIKQRVAETSNTKEQIQETEKDKKQKKENLLQPLKTAWGHLKKDPLLSFVPRLLNLGKNSEAIGHLKKDPLLSFVPRLLNLGKNSNASTETPKTKVTPEISSEKPPHNPSTAIFSESMPQRKPLQQNEGISSSKTTNATAKIEPEKASQSTVGEKLIKGIFGNSDKFLDKIAKNSDTTNQNLTLLVHGFNGLSKALEKFGVTVSQNSNEGGNTTVINSQTGKQRTLRSAEIAKSGNREIASFRMEMEKLRGQPA